MATLVLTAVGGAIAGPIGAAIGSLIGQQVDQRAFAPKGRKGPRLGELSIQTSSYGTAIPKLFGTMRVAGTVIWATDLREEKHKSGGGKGRPKTTSYSYSASFAVALSGRPVREVKRIWADGKLLRGAAGDFKSATGFRLYRGDEAQQPDPLIVSVEGAAEAPAYRGIAYVVFEDFELADYGNRIPSLTFEVVADAGAVPIGQLAHELSDGGLEDGGTPALAGFAASGDSVRGALEAIAEAVPLTLADGAVPILRSSGIDGGTVAGEETGARDDDENGGRTEVARAAAAGIPAQVAISYHDPARDYQAGLQRAARGGTSTPAIRSEAIALPAVLDGSAAKALAEARLAALWAGRSSARMQLSWRRIGLRPGTEIRIPDHAGRWRVVGWTLERMIVRLDLRRVASASLPPAAAEPGRAVPAVDLVQGSTRLRLIELPQIQEQILDRPQLAVAAAGAVPGWRRAALSLSLDGGASWEGIGATAAPATIGVARDALGPGGAAMFDTRNSVEVELEHDGMWLEGRDDAALGAGANLALIGRELVQFGLAEPLGERRFRLGRLLRGRRGTEWAAVDHAAGEPFTLIEAETLAPVENMGLFAGAELRVSALGIGDEGEGVEAGLTLSGEAVRPPQPVHLTARRAPDGGWTLHWVRRSRLGWSWPSGADTPLGEEREAYRVTISGVGFSRTATVAEPSFVYDAAAHAADGGGNFAAEIVQLGTHAASRAARLVVQP